MESHISEQPLCCNECYGNIDNIAYKTKCSHLLCISCAQCAFTTGNVCPVCRMGLTNADILEVTVGIQAIHDFTAQATHFVLQGHSLESLLRDHKHMMTALTDITHFLSTQVMHAVLMEAKIKDEVNKKNEKLSDDLLAARDEIDRLTETTCAEREQHRSQISAAEREYAELKEIHAEKSRKCIAWEKAYVTLKAEVLKKSAATSDFRLRDACPETQEDGTSIKPPQAENFAVTSSTTFPSHSMYGTALAHANPKNGDVDGRRAVRKRTETMTISHHVVPPHFAGHPVREGQAQHMPRYLPSIQNQHTDQQLQKRSFGDAHQISTPVTSTQTAQSHHVQSRLNANIESVNAVKTPTHLPHHDAHGRAQSRFFTSDGSVVGQGSGRHSAFSMPSNRNGNSGSPLGASGAVSAEEHAGNPRRALSLTSSRAAASQFQTQTQGWRTESSNESTPRSQRSSLSSLRGGGEGGGTRGGTFSGGLGREFSGSNGRAVFFDP